MNRKATSVATFAACLIVITTLAGCQSGEATSARTANQIAGEQYDNRPITENSATLTVQGMSCPKCANNIDLALGEVAGVEKLNIDLSSGQVKVNFVPNKPHPSRLQLAQAVEKTGFTLAGITTP